MRLLKKEDNEDSKQKRGEQAVIVMKRMKLTMATLTMDAMAMYLIVDGMLCCLYYTPPNLYYVYDKLLHNIMRLS